LEGTLKIIWVQPPCHEQGRLPVNQVAKLSYQMNDKLNYQSYSLHVVPVVFLLPSFPCVVTRPKSAVWQEKHKIICLWKREMHSCKFLLERENSWWVKTTDQITNL